MIHSNNVNSAFNGFRAAGELGIKQICYASSVNAIGLVFSTQPLELEYFPIDEKRAAKPTDPYALANLEAKVQAKALAHWFPGTKIASLRIHEVAALKDVQKEHQEDWENIAVKQLWGWVHPQATARACLAAVEKSDNWKGAEVFNVVAPTTTQETPSVALAKKYYPKAESRQGLDGNKAFWTIAKAPKLLE